MRPLETLLSLANLLACLVLIAPGLRAASLVIPAALLIAAVQVLLEGDR